MGSKFGISRCKLFCREWIEDKVMVYSTGNSIQYTVQTITENNMKKNVDWNTKVGSEKICGKTGKFGGVKKEVGQRLAEFCQENELVIENTHFQQ